MDSCITLEYIDHEVLKVLNTVEAIQKTAVDDTRACIEP
jgi:hypothetical protein